MLISISFNCFIYPNFNSFIFINYLRWTICKYGFVFYKNEAIKVWIYKAIKTNRYQYEIYSWDYGSEIESLIGKGFEIGFIKSETQRYIEEALLINPYITKINKIDVEFSKDVLTAYVDLETVYGRLDMYV